MSKRFRVASCVATWVIFMAACTAPEEPFDFSTTDLSVSYAESPVIVTHEVPDDIVALGDADGVVVIGTTRGVYGLYGLELLELEVYSLPGEPLDTGGVTAIAPRAEGLLIAAEKGLFHTFESALLYSPVSVALEGAQVHAMSVVGEGEKEEVWFATSKGLLHASGEVVDAIEIAGERAAATAVAGSASIVLVAYGARLYEIDLDASTSRLVTDAVGNIGHIDQADGVFTMNAGGAVLVRSGAGEYTEYRIDEGAGEVTVSEARYHASLGAVGLTHHGVLTIQDGVGTGLAPIASDADGRLTFDKYGNVWVGSGTALTGLMVGEQTSFVDDVASILSKNCAGCHATGVNGAPVYDFSDHGVVKAISDTIIQRVTLGTMPPTGPLGGTDIDLLVRWYVSGQNP